LPFHFGTLDNIDDLEHEGDAVWRMDVETGSEQHGLTMHVNHPVEDEWRETDMEMTGYFKLIDSEDQIITLIARHGRVEVTGGTMAAKRYAIMGC
jgi:hypothetical protein